MEKVYKNCQSCGMPLKRDDKGGGTNADGSKSIRFCSHCYALGNFTKPTITVDEMKALVKTKLKEFGIPGFLSPVFTRHIPTLERWKTR
jgi:Putative zinc ribbon domain